MHCFTWQRLLTPSSAGKPSWTVHASVIVLANVTLTSTVCKTPTYGQNIAVCVCTALWIS